MIPSVQNIPWFSEWLVGYARDWGSFLNTTDSFSQEIMDSFINDSPDYAVRDSMIDGRPNAPSGWLTFNQFFARELNPGLRPIADPADNLIVTSPADCTFRAKYAVGADSAIPGITVKKTHKFASIEDLLEGSQYGSSFANGTFVHYFLSPYSYHRFHAPVAGIVRECYPVRGLVCLDVGIDKQQFHAPDSSESGGGSPHLPGPPSGTAECKNERSELFAGAGFIPAASSPRFACDSPGLCKKSLRLIFALRIVIPNAVRNLFPLRQRISPSGRNDRGGRSK